MILHFLKLEIIRDVGDVILSRAIQVFNITPAINIGQQSLIYQFRQEFLQSTSFNSTYNVVIFSRSNKS